MWPKAFWERFYEPIIRASAGLGRLSMEPDPDRYDHGYLHCDLLVIGAGPAGLSGALAAARAGLRVILADEDFAPGGRLNSETYEVNGQAGPLWANAAVAELSAMDNVRVMTRTTVHGAYDHGIYGVLERKTDHLPSSYGKPRQVHWRVYSKRALLCAGATERSIAFGNNDRPGIMMAGAVRTYVNRFGVAPGRKVAIFTNNDDGPRTAESLTDRGLEVTGVIDARAGELVVNTVGRHRLKKVILNNGCHIDTDCLAVSGGWSPNVHLTSHHRGSPLWRDDIAAFVPGSELPVGMVVAGAANGAMTLSAAINDSHSAASKIASELGATGKTGAVPQTSDEKFSVSAFWHVSESTNRAWVDLQNDVTTKDVRQSHEEGFRAVEHLKRYTTLGMATDQGKTANVLGLAM